MSERTIVAPTGPLMPADVEDTIPTELIDGAPTFISPGVRRQLLRDMLRIRKFELRVFDLYWQSLVRYSTHLSLGQEAIAAAFGAAQRSDDYTLCTYRGHGHAMARGVTMTAMLGEFMGRTIGVNGGRGGSIHLTSLEHGLLGSYAIVGAHLPIANGAALSAQLRGTDQVVTCFFGDGATNIGAFHEALNLAKVWNLPVVFVCENNLYMEYTPTRTVTAVPRPAADRAMAYGLEPVVVDGNDADRIYATAVAAVERARRGDGPVLVEAITYRQRGHSRGDEAKYRDNVEVEAWMKRDPIERYRGLLIDEGVLTVEEVEQMEAAVTEEVAAAEEIAKAAPWPDPQKDLLTELWADGSATWRN